MEKEMKNKIMRISDALNLIKEGDLLAISAAGRLGWPEYVVTKLEERYLEEHTPRNLTLFSGCGHDDDHFAHLGFLKRFVGSHPQPAPQLLEMAAKGEIEAYVLPQGILQQLYRCSSAKQPGLLSKIGMGTYIDPRQEGGKINAAASKEDIIEPMEIKGEEWLYYKSFPINVGIVRGTSADCRGNITIEHEAIKLEILEIALAAKAQKGKVIVQVERIVADGTLKAKDIVIPGGLVDAVVVCEDLAAYHMQTMSTLYNPFFSGEIKGPPIEPAKGGSELGATDIICRRAVFELFKGAIVNVGVGVGGGVGPVVAEEGIINDVTFSVELGVFGGTPQPIPEFPATYNPESFLSHTAMFDFYHGGGLDITFLGAAQVDRKGNVNVSKFRGVTAGQGGFIDISQTSSKVVFCLLFTAKGLETSIECGKLKILQEGKIKKFLTDVEQITFNGQRSHEAEQEIIVCTERAVFQLFEKGLTLTEIAPGIDLGKDILANMEFKPIISPDLKNMDSRIFVPGRMGCFD
jgi:propionate CoA-transferase